MRRRWIPIFLVITFLGVCAGTTPAQDQNPPRGIILSWDGAVPSFAHELLRAGKMPNLAKLIEEGSLADSVTTVFPSETAPGFASLWTGAPPRINGISGNQMPATPRSQFTMLESVSGFASTSLRAEPLWLPAARSGRRVVVLQATQGYPFKPYLTNETSGLGPSARLVMFEGYAGSAARDGVITERDALPRNAQGWTNLPESLAPPLEIEFRIGLSRFFGLLIDDPQYPQRRYNTLVLARERDGDKAEARLTPGFSSSDSIGQWSPIVEVEMANRARARTFLRLFDLHSNGKSFLLYFTRPTRSLTTNPELLPSIHKTEEIFIGNGAFQPYRQGALGTPLSKGGDGTAERRYLETVRFVQRKLMGFTRQTMQQLEWDLILTYTPYPDEAEHLWRGYLDSNLPGFRQELAARLRPFLEEVYRSCDEFLGSLIETRPEQSVIALVSDHGMEGTNKVFMINTALQKAGLLAVDNRGRVDLAKTQAWYPGYNNAYILINSADRKGGIVSPEERPEVIARIRRALDQIRDGDRQVVTQIFDAQNDGEALGIGGEAGGDIYLDLLPGHEFSSQFNAPALIVEREPHGTHEFSPLRQSTRTVLVLNGPGVARGRRLPEARTIDFAPTLAALLGLPPPRQSTGRIMDEALSR